MVQSEPTPQGQSRPRTGGLLRANVTSDVLVLFWPTGTEEQANIVILDVDLQTRRITPSCRLSTLDPVHDLVFSRLDPQKVFGSRPARLADMPFYLSLSS